MTLVGKILVFLNLIFSVATAGLIVMVFTTRASWKTEYEKMRNVALVAEAAYKSTKISQDSDARSSQSLTKSEREEKLTITKERDALIATNDDLRKQITTEREENRKQVAINSSLTSEVDALKTERDTLTGDVQKLRGEKLLIQKELNDQKLKTVNNQIEADSQRARAERLLTRLEEVEKNLNAANARLTALQGAGGKEPSLLNPPPVPAPRDVKGTVRAVGTGGIVVISLGSDSGLNAGNKLEVYRIDPQNPLKSLYLGELVISRTEPKQAVGQFYPKPFAKPDERLPKVDDIVSTGLGSR
jgi:hypothetical protein